MKLLRKLGLAALYIPVVFVGLVTIFLGLGLLELAVNSARGYQLVTLKTTMYWENGKVLAGDKLKTWKIAVPNRIVLRQNRDAWSLYTFRTPVYSNRREDFGSDRFVTTLTVLNAQEQIIPYTPGLGGKSFSMTFTNMIPFSSPGPRNDNPTYYRIAGTSATCVSRNSFIEYHGWVIRISPSDLSPERKCAIVSAALDRWTVLIDDLYSKDSGQ
jgi:hypothetical protein